MNKQRKWIGLIVLIALTCLVYFLLPKFPGIVAGYDHCLFYPFQTFRGLILGHLPFSIGDVLYIAGGVWLLVILIKWVRYLIGFSMYKVQLGNSIIRTIKTILFFYLFFIAGWGANYYKPSLIQRWVLTSQTPPPQTDAEKAKRKMKSLENLVAFNHFLAGKLNEYVTGYQSLPLKEINNRAEAYYGTFTDSKVSKYGLKIKPGLFGYFMRRLGVEGYYNPFTGEGQIDAYLPGFTMPFLICHEMAHQAGIASEEDANLMAYALGTTTPDSTFRYSAYLNIWLYANNRLYRRDSVKALEIESLLSKLTKAHIDTLEEISKKYQNGYARYSSQLYDNYLKMQDQKDGIRSYGNVVVSAWLLEQKRKIKVDSLIRIP